MIDTKHLYIELIKKCILGYIYKDASIASFPTFHEANYESDAFDGKLRESGRDWPSQAHSMIGLKRMDNLQFCVEDVLVNDIPGDMVETGVWRGGSCIFMRALLKANGVTDRNVWVCDSFEGLPPPNPEKYPLDGAVDFSQFSDQLGVTLEQVQENFRLYELLDDQVKFLKGWFSDTLPLAPIKVISVLRLDGDMYESTMDALTNLYHKLSIGGYCIIDDWAIPMCGQAVKDYRQQNNIVDEIVKIDGIGAYWKKSR